MFLMPRCPQRSNWLVAGSLVALVLAGTGTGRTQAGEMTSPVVDDSALRYYANHNEPERFQAELKRLSSLYPEWTPPKDLSQTGADPETELWTLFAGEDPAALDAEIERRRSIDPHFTLSADLSGKIDMRKARRQLLDAAASGRDAEVMALSQSRPMLGGCEDLEIAWAIAAARSTAGGAEASRDAYRALLETCKTPNARFATLEKAIARLGQAALPLLTLAAADTSATLEPARRAVLEARLVREQLTAALADPTFVHPDEAMVARFVVSALASGPAEDSGLVGWWHLSRNATAEALSAFETAARQIDPLNTVAAERDKIAEGRIRALERLGRHDEAFALAKEARKTSDVLAALFADIGARRFEGVPRPRVPDADIAAYAEAVTASASPSGAEALGWYAYDYRQYAVARGWFAAALDAKPSEAAASGLVLATYAGGDAKTARLLVETWRQKFPGLSQAMGPQAEPKKPVARRQERDPLLVRFEQEDHRGCVAMAKKRKSEGGLSAELSLIEGWCLMKLDRPREAVLAFGAATLGKGQVRKDATYGRSLALFAAGDLGAATASAGDEAMSAPRRDEVGIAVLAEQAIAAFDRKRWKDVLVILDGRRQHAAEPNNLAMMRGWALWHLRRKSEAETVFSALDQALSTRQTRLALATVRQEQFR